MNNNNLYEQIFLVIQRSYSIKKHVDFFDWLRDCVSEVLPHDMLLACWGVFEKKQPTKDFNYDVTSQSDEISTQIIFDSSENVNNFMRHLHMLWLKNNRRWYVLNNFEELKLNQNLNNGLPDKFNQFNSLLVYGISDIRGSNECLYLFFSKEIKFEVPDSVLGLIMPHIDNALRKIKHLDPLDVPIEANANSADLSVRELEIIHWVKSGKTNNEIAMILCISQNTVKNHLKHIFGKLDVTSRAQAVGKL